MEEQKLHIPYGAKIEKELFLGFSRREAKHCLIGWAATILLAAGFYFATLNGLGMVTVGIVGMAVSVIVSRRQVYSQSIVGVAKSALRFFTEQQHYKYVFAHQYKSDKEGEECQIPLVEPKRHGKHKQAQQAA